MDNKIIERVRKLLTMANDNAAGGENERDTALRMAHKILAKHNLSMADVKGAEKEGRGKIEKEMTSHAWGKIVAASIARLFFCEFFTTKVGSSSQTRMRMTFVGLESNVATAKEMVDYVISSITKEAANAAKRIGATGGFQRSFCNGAAEQISIRCNKLRKEAEDASKAEPTMSAGTSLVLASLYDQERLANDGFIKNQLQVNLEFKDLRPTSNSSNGRMHGKIYGDKINLNKQIGGSS